MAQARDAVTPAPTPAPTNFRALHSAAVNALDGLLAPLVALRAELGAAADAEVYVSQAESRLADLNGMIAAREHDLREIEAQVPLAEANTVTRIAAERERVAEAKARAKADIERVQEEKAADLNRIETAHNDAVRLAQERLREIDARIEAHQRELRAAEAQLAATREAQAAFRAAAGAGVGGS